MAHQHESIDLTTLEEVHRLLSTVDFASIDDHRSRSSDDPAHGATIDLNSMDTAPLPRRR